MQSRKFPVHFGLLFLPCLLASAISVFIYNLNSDQSISWAWTILLAIVLDAMITWMNLREERGRDQSPDAQHQNKT
ncbi:MAG: hypothetical protein WBD36_09945 [Bacteroidota bacterium]